MSEVTVKTNNIPRDIINGYELNAKEREQFSYIDESETHSWDEAEFFRYRGQLYDLGEFSADYGITRGAGLPEHLSKWDGYMSESAFSAIVVRYVDNNERVIVGLVLS